MAPSGFTAQRYSTADGRTRLALTGELDVATVPRAQAEVELAWREGRPIVLDVDELEFMDSTGLRLVLEAVARARLEGLELVITPGSPPVRRLFEISGVAELLPLAEASSGLGLEPAEVGLDPATPGVDGSELPPR